VRLCAPLLTALALGLAAAAPAAADTHYLEGSGSVQGVHFTGFVIAADGQPPRGWLSFGSGAHAVVTCTAITTDAAVQGYMIDLGAEAGSGLLSSTQYTDPTESGGYIVYAGFLSKPVKTCPTPGAAPPPGFSPGASGPVQDGVVRNSDSPPPGPTDIVDVLPGAGATVPARPFVAFADLNGDGAASLTLALVRRRDSKTIRTIPVGPNPSGLDARAEVPALPGGHYLAAWTLYRMDGTTSTKTSALTVKARRRHHRRSRHRRG
jgi:hypothetical protein